MYTLASKSLWLERKAKKRRICIELTVLFHPALFLLWKEGTYHLPALLCSTDIAVMENFPGVSIGMILDIEGNILWSSRLLFITVTLLLGCERIRWAIVQDAITIINPRNILTNLEELIWSENLFCDLPSYWCILISDLAYTSCYSLDAIESIHCLQRMFTPAPAALWLEAMLTKNFTARRSLPASPLLISKYPTYN